VASRISEPDKAVLTSSRYISGWPKLGDGGVVVEVGEPVGAAWYRLLPAVDHGYGFVDERTPEVTVGVTAQWRGKGLGRLLLKALSQSAEVDGYEKLSLSVEEDNYALGLYEAIGFERLNHVGNAWTMVMHLHDKPSR
jgi:GNAT superfamily N-acetyltransferase